jgi:hypothetical protein
MEQHKARPRWLVMQAKRHDDLKDSFYLYIMRNSIGAGLRSQYPPDQVMPDRLAELLRELDGAEGKATGIKEGQNPPSTPKRVRKR